ncbi:MAG: rhodanese-like domain-containing protein [Gordonia sp. (in: high G+C Gram-positive bacteria)]|uniref:rhodanese-like domain-containing protein n=1 Tax=Gordonia sp. (in: high G+C Gram-positive bacteria) TaxID=84139 RepID=UPI0039E6B5A2
MTLAFDVPVTTSFGTLSEEPTPLSVQTAQYRSLIDDGAVVVDLRSAQARHADGALLGAIALDLDDALTLLTPGAPGALRSASYEARWLLITEDGYDAEQLAWHLQARGVRGARFLVGGHRALRAAGITGAVDAAAHHLFS